jgi:hypothetical protein
MLCGRNRLLVLLTQLVIDYFNVEIDKRASAIIRRYPWLSRIESPFVKRTKFLMKMTVLRWKLRFVEPGEPPNKSFKEPA